MSDSLLTVLKAREKDIFGKVVSQIIDKIVSTNYFKTEQKKDLDELNRLENSILASLESSKDLQEVYKNVLTKERANTRSGGMHSIIGFFRGNNIVYQRLEKQHGYYSLIKIDLDNNFYQAYYNRGSVYKRLGKSDLADKDFAKAQKLAKQEIEQSK